MLKNGDGVAFGLAESNANFSLGDESAEPRPFIDSDLFISDGAEIYSGQPNGISARRNFMAENPAGVPPYRAQNLLPSPSNFPRGILTPSY